MNNHSGSPEVQTKARDLPLAKQRVVWRKRLLRASTGGLFLAVMVRGAFGYAFKGYRGRLAAVVCAEVFFCSALIE